MLEWLEQQATLFPEHTKIQWVLGSVYLSNGDKDKAWHRFVQTLKVGDSSSILEIALRKSYSNSFNYSEKWTDVLEISTQFPTSQFWIEELLDSTNSVEQAQILLAHLQSLNPEKVEWIGPMLEVLNGMLSSEVVHP